jgi:hypothetical protein
MNIWLRYLAIAVLIGNGFAALSNLIALGRGLRLGSFGDGVGLMAFNLAVSFSAIALAGLIAAGQGISLKAKAFAVLSALGGGFGILSSALSLHILISQPEDGLLMEARDAYIASFTMERLWQNAFFSVCTLALAIVVLASRRTSAQSTSSP